MKLRTGVAVFAAICTLVPIFTQTIADQRAGWMMIDFRAYYCAALLQRQGVDPYYARPLHQCESTTPAPFYRAPKRVTVPAPYPPYALTLLAPLTFLPFAAAAVVWWALIAVAIAVAAWALSNLCERPFLVGLAAFALSLGLTCFSAGNAMPLAVAALTAAALCCRLGKGALSALFVAIAMLEPNVALPAALGLFAAFSKARWPLAIAGCLLIATSLFAGGFARNIEYFTVVLPAHALSEVSRDNQYSLSTVVSAIGASDTTATLIGGVSYIAALLLGLAVGVRLYRCSNERAFAVVIPVAFALIGGTFVHVEAIAAAIPAALLLYGHSREHHIWAFASILLLSVPWMLATSAALFLAPLFPAPYLTYTLFSRERSKWALAALATFGLIVALFVLAVTPAHPTPFVHNRPLIDPRFAEAAWRDYVLNDSTNRLAMWLLRLPTWIGLFAVAGVAISLTRPTALQPTALADR